MHNAKVRGGIAVAEKQRPNSSARLPYSVSIVLLL
jgi:hypothetical protein